MIKRTIVFFDDTHPIMPQRLSALGFECIDHTNSTLEDMKSDLQQAFGLVGRSRFQLDEHFLKWCSNLQFIARSGVGTEHIDLEYARTRHIKVFTSPEGSADTVGEHTLGLLLMLMNLLGRADRQVRSGHWIREENRGTELKGKTIGILGYGNMGKSLARKLKGLEVQCITYDKYLINYGDENARQVDLPTFFQETDVLAIHIPYLPSNHYFINRTFLESFHKPIYLVNAARGMVLHTPDLVEGLSSGKILGAALDVLEYEDGSFSALKASGNPAPLDYLIQSEVTVLSPHIAGWSYESLKGHAEVLVKKISQNFYR
jgi:D-3-phosphoglycerate dehydrogenase